jgi:hypothetical protein
MATIIRIVGMKVNIELIKVQKLNGVENVFAIQSKKHLQQSSKHSQQPLHIESQQSPIDLQQSPHPLQQ